MEQPEPTFVVERSNEGPRVEVRLVGELDMAAAASAIREAAQAAEGAEAVVVDLSGLTFIDSTGLNALVRIRHLSAEPDGPQVVLRSPSPAISKVLRLTALSDYLDIGE